MFNPWNNPDKVMLNVAQRISEKVDIKSNDIINILRIYHDVLAESSERVKKNEL